MKKILFPKKGKSSPIIRTYIVLLYTALILGIIFIFVNSFVDTGRQNVLDAGVVQQQLSFVLLNPSIGPETVRVFENANISGSERDLSEFNDGYEYKYHLLHQEIPNLASHAENPSQAENIRKVADILEQNLEDYSQERSEIFSPTSAILDGFLLVTVLVLPAFLFFRAVGYRILLYIVFDDSTGEKNIK